MNPVEFTIPAVPVAQPRQRHRIVSGANGGFVKNYTPEKAPVNAFKATARHALRAAYDGPPLSGPLALSVEFVFPRPKGMVWKKKPMPRVAKATAPDLDNLLKAVKDGLKGLAWIDDAQVVAYCPPLVKWFAAGDEQPHVRVIIKQFESAGGRIYTSSGEGTGELVHAAKESA